MLKDICGQRHDMGWARFPGYGQVAWAWAVYSEEGILCSECPAYLTPVPFLLAYIALIPFIRDEHRELLHTPSTA